MHNDSPAPKKRGRPSKKEAGNDAPATVRASATPPLQLSDFGVSEVTAHRPVSLLEVQDAA
ncbi:MAG: hypothetical protein Q4C89_07200, partial [Deinococcus sp.]|uniref:hypothetical protein n=1 Tax=Deinococcus sp. TaxID=47478 RepID=UPI0026DC3754